VNRKKIILAHSVFENQWFYCNFRELYLNWQYGLQVKDWENIRS